MTFGLLNLLMLLGLAGLAIPPLIHLLNRRRFHVVDWGAMQFLKISETTRRRLLIEEVLLMMLRMLLIAVMVLGLAGPWALSDWLPQLSTRPNRDVVLVFDGSASMSYLGTGKSAHQAAQEWAEAFVSDLLPGDSVAVLQAKQQVVPVLGEPSHDLEKVREAIQRLPAPRGGCDWPEALKFAQRLLTQSQRPHRDIILLSDGQRHGWADETTLLRWELLAYQLREAGELKPRVWVVNLDPNRPAEPPNWSLAPLRSTRAVVPVGRQITFRTALELGGQAEYQPPHRVRLEIDGQPVNDLRPPASAELAKGQVPLSFRQRFATPGVHLVSVILEPDPPPEQRTAGYAIKDHLPADNRQDLAVEVVTALPVLLVDGDTQPRPKNRGTDFLRDALAPARDPNPACAVRVVAAHEFQAEMLTSDVKQPGSRPRVLVLSDIAQLTAAQQAGITRFLAEGGGVLVTLGERADARHYNQDLYQGGTGWLPARLEKLAGDELRPDQASRPLATSFFHPALDLFRATGTGGLADARFPRWYSVTTPGKNAAAVPLALLSSNEPLLVERAFRTGRVLLATVPLDNSWRTNLVDLPAFAPLVHELVFYLAGARAASWNLAAEQPLRYRPWNDDAPAPLKLELPTGALVDLNPARWPLVYEGTKEAGVYKLFRALPKDAPDSAAPTPTWFVVQPDPRETNLAGCDDKDRDKVSQLVPGLTYENDAAPMHVPAGWAEQKQELWQWVMAGVILLLCSEVWLTRRVVRGQ